MNYLSKTILIIFLIFISIYELRNYNTPYKYIVFYAMSGFILSFYDTRGSIIESLMGFIIIGGTLYIVYYLMKGGIGKKDALLAACTGISFGLQDSLIILLLASLLCWLSVLVLLLIKKVKRKSSISFSPYLLISTIFVVLMS